MRKPISRLVEYETLGDSYTLERMSNSPVRIKKASNMSQGENYHMGDNGYWANNGQRARMMSVFRSRSYHANCSARYLDAYEDVLQMYLNVGGSFQALIDPQALNECNSVQLFCRLSGLQPAASCTELYYCII